MREDDARLRPRERTRKWLAATGLAGWALGGLVWASQALPAARMNPQLCYSLVIWLFAWGITGVDAAMFFPDAHRTSRLFALGVALRHAGPGAAGTGGVASREAVYRACGVLGAATWVSAATVDGLTAAGVWHFQGLNFRLFTLFVLVVASRATVIRIAGPNMALADMAESSAATAARLAREYESRLPAQQHRQATAKRRTTR